MRVLFLAALVLASTVSAQRTAVNICKAPSGGVKRGPGTIHDDETNQINCTKTKNCGTTANSGYGDNLNCGVNIHAPKGQTVNAVFTQINLEAGGAHKGCGRCPAKGCDYVSIYDGTSATARLIGTFSGTKIPPAIRSTKQDLFVVFRTDHFNCGITGSADPGFYLDYHFVAHATGGKSSICVATHGGPAKVYTTSTGTISDDQPHGGVKCTGTACGKANQGYGDNLDCGVEIKAPTGDTVNLRFTQMNLESGRPNKACGQCPTPGCDKVSVYDGPSASARLIGVYSGTKPPSKVVKGTQQSMFVRFQTDSGNCQISGKSDPGFFAKWSFQADGLNICHAPSIVRANTGVLHDDKPNQGLNCQKAGGACGSKDSVGYGDNLDCGVALRAPAGKIVQVEFYEVNLEARGCSTPNPCPPEGCDYVALYDGINNSSRRIGTYTGYIDVKQTSGPNAYVTKTAVSSGRNMFVRFKTDFHNCGIKQTMDPGFFAKWKFVDPPLKLQAGQKQRTVFIGSSSISNKTITVNGVTSCSATPVNPQDPAWNSVFNVRVVRANTIVVKRVDHRASQHGWVQRLVIRCAVGAAAPPPPAQTLVSRDKCIKSLYSLENSLNNICCRNGCPSNGMISTCNQQCAAVWMPYSNTCSEYLRLDPQLNSLLNITATCENTRYGKFTGNYFGGRCSTIDYNKYTDKVSKKCCGPNGIYCKANTANTGPKEMMLGSCGAGYEEIKNVAACNVAASTLNLGDKTASVVSMPSNPLGCYFKKTTNQLYFNRKGNVKDLDKSRLSICVPQGASTGVGLQTGSDNLPSTCDAACALSFESFYSECQPRFAKEGLLPQYRAFLQKCQGVYHN